MGSILTSKINWTQIVGFLASILAIWGFDVPAEFQAQVVLLFQAIQSVLTMVFRIWFNKASTPSA